MIETQKILEVATVQKVEMRYVEVYERWKMMDSYI